MPVCFRNRRTSTSKIGVPIVMIFLDQNVIINGGGRQLNFPGAPDLGYHEWMITTAGNPLLYAFMWYNSDIGQITWVATHEFAETMTDPLYNAWTPDHAFHEIGDYCDGNTVDIVVNGRTWLIQTVWSNADNSCVAEAPSKLPPLHPGPFGAAAAAIGQGRGPSAYPDIASIRSHDRVLPLPSVHFNHLTNSVQIRDTELMA
jgi:hypothetical protein